MKQPLDIGDWRAEPARNTLVAVRPPGEERRLSRKAMDVLLYLAAQPGAVVGRETLVDAVWQGRAISDDALATVIYELRRALGDDARRPRYVETIRTRGYRLVATVEAAALPAPVPTEVSPRDAPGQAIDQVPNLRRSPRALRLALAAALLATLTSVGWLGLGTLEVPADVGDTVPEVAAWRDAEIDALPDAPVCEPRSLAFEEVLFTVDPRASEAWQLGSHFLRRNAHDQALRYFAMAAKRQPEWAPPHVGVADTYLAAADVLPAPARSDAVRRATRAVEEALRIDDSSAGAHITRASIAFEHEWDFLRAADHFARGWQDTSCSVEDSRPYARYLSALGRHEEAIAAMRLSLERDPASSAGRWTLAWVYAMARRYDEALDELELAEELADDDAPVCRLRSEVLLAAGRPEEAIASVQRTMTLGGSDPRTVAQLGGVFARDGLDGAIRWLRTRALAASEIEPVRLASLDARLGDLGAAVSWLDLAWMARDPELLWLRVDPAFDVLRGEPRFDAMVERLDFGS